MSHVKSFLQENWKLGQCKIKIIKMQFFEISLFRNKFLQENLNYLAQIRNWSNAKLR
jgi:hypothetical protein